MDDISCSLVAFDSNPDLTEKAIKSFLNTQLRVKLFLIDNSREGFYRVLLKDKRIEYISNLKNIGFGAGHNIGLNKSVDNFKYHLVLNPDVYFGSGTLEKIFRFAEENKDIGLIMPKVLYPDGSLQYLCKLLPTPFDFFMRRFLSRVPVINYWVDKKNAEFELRFTGYKQTMDVPVLSGCFMFIRSEALKEIGVFDERYFVYCEDFDFSRRMRSLYRTVYYPEASIFHEYAKTSAKNFKIFNYHIASTIKYFNKWGWFFDAERKAVNKETLRNILRMGKN